VATEGGCAPYSAIRNPNSALATGGLVAPKSDEGGWKPTHLASGDENCRCQNQFGMDELGKRRLNFIYLNES
jgi:hypothetical protein